MQQLKYNYIIAGGSADYYHVAYSDLDDLPNVIYYSGYIDGINSRIKRLLARINFNIRVNKFVETPLRKFVNPWLFPNTFDGDNLCFVFFECQYAIINSDYIQYLRQHYPKAKLVLYMQDIVASLPYYDISKYKKIFDLILSYDKGDSERYGLLYYPTPYSKKHLKKIITEDIDVFFCGASKNRYDEIISAYRKCTSQGLKCKFFVTGVPADKQVGGKGLIYNTPITYEENLAYIAKSKCILEIIQKNAKGYSLRLWEAITYDKHLLTNNTSIVECNCYHPESIHLISDNHPMEDWINNEVVIPTSYKNALSPMHFLSFIEQHFNV